MFLCLQICNSFLPLDGITKLHHKFLKRTSILIALKINKHLHNNGTVLKCSEIWEIQLPILSYALKNILIETNSKIFKIQVYIIQVSLWQTGLV